ncbi:MAG: transcription termination factor NusA [Bacteroidota bacterium]
MNQEFVEALDQLERERGIAKEVLVEAVEAALVSALKRDQKSAQNVRVQLDPGTGEIRVFNRRTVVEEVLDDREEIALADAKALDPRYALGDVVEEEIMPKEFGRIAAQTAKQVVVQRIREAERSLIYDEFANRVGDIITGIVQRYEQRNVFIDLGKVEGILPPSEQMPGERYEQGTRLKVFIVEVKRTTKGPQVVISRTRAGLLKRLFELEVPEIQDGLVEIKAVAREPGARSKIAVYSREPHVDPVGACVGARGNRVQMIVRELKGEKIDIIPWNPDWEMFIAKAMSPARVAAVQLAPSKKISLVVVPDHQLSLAIGREGQNARLAAKLTGWKIDIRSESQIAEMSEEELEAIIPLEDEFVMPTEEPIAEEELQPVADLAEQDMPPAVDAQVYDESDAAVIESEERPAAGEEEEAERAREGAKRKIRKGRAKQRELEMELETLDDTGMGFFSDVLGSRHTQDSSRMESALPAEHAKGAVEPVIDSVLAAAFAKAKETGGFLAEDDAAKHKPDQERAKTKKAPGAPAAAKTKQAATPEPAVGENTAKVKKAKNKGE